MGIFTTNPARLDAAARSLHLRADQLDRQGKHASALVERKKAARLEAKAATKG